MYIAQAGNYLNNWYYYILGSLFTIIGVFIFSLPHAIAIAIKAFGGNSEALDFSDTKVLMNAFSPNVNLIFILLPFLGGILALFIFVKYFHKQPLVSLTTSRTSIDWKRIWFAFIFWGAISTIMVGLDYILYPSDYIVNFNLNQFIVLAIIAILLIPIQTSFEEYFFRGYLMQGLGLMVKNKWFPLIVTSVFFGGLHIANPEVAKIGNIILIYYIGTGLFLGIITLMDEGMELAIGFHASNNLIGALLVSADWTAFQTHSILKDISDPTESAGLYIFTSILVIYPLLLLIFARKYKWNNWRDKLFGKVVLGDQAS